MAVSSMKLCTKCKEYKPLEEFHLNSQQKSGRHPRCAVCKNLDNINQWNSLSEEEQQKRSRQRQLKYRYGITLEDYDSLLEEQNYVCAICERPHQAWRGAYLTVDHDHDTGEVRGLLCGSCNAAIGKFEDNPEFIINAYLYLMKGGDSFGSFK